MPSSMPATGKSSSPSRKRSAKSPADPSRDSAHERQERTRQDALKDLESLRYEGGGFGAGWTQSALVRSLFRTNKEATDITPRLRRIIIILRVLSFIVLSLWVIYYLANF